MLFDSVEFVELGKEESTELIEKYNKEGKDNLPPPEKKTRWGGKDKSNFQFYQKKNKHPFSTMAFIKRKYNVKWQLSCIH